MFSKCVTRREFVEQAGSLAAFRAMGSLLPLSRLMATDLPTPQANLMENYKI